MAVFVIRKGKKQLVLEKSMIADSSFKRFKGLMLESKENFDYALVFPLDFESRYGASIHMMFMNFPIDVLFLNSRKEIVDVVESLKPWTLNCTPKKPAKYIIEMPAGIARKKKIKVGEKAVFN
ncbi:MAG: DUF192 domain-containing protein [Candidatus Diapherotrites archaeon]|nr:DUF192 domain-containing protein [Candidatus Diapherotrites archaeon]